MGSVGMEPIQVVTYSQLREYLDPHNVYFLDEYLSALKNAQIYIDLKCKINPIFLMGKEYKAFLVSGHWSSGMEAFTTSFFDGHMHKMILGSHKQLLKEKEAYQPEIRCLSSDKLIKTTLDWARNHS